jgi:hypothetical protein
MIGAAAALVRVLDRQRHADLATGVVQIVQNISLEARSWATLVHAGIARALSELQGVAIHTRVSAALIQHNLSGDESTIAAQIRGGAVHCLKRVCTDKINDDASPADAVALLNTAARTLANLAKDDESWWDDSHPHDSHPRS